MNEPVRRIIKLNQTHENMKVDSGKQGFQQILKLRNYRWIRWIRFAPVLPAVVESLHGERSEQFALNDARTAFLLRNCARAQDAVSPVGLRKRNSDEPNALLTLPGNIFLPRQFEEQGKVIRATGHFNPRLFASSLHLLENVHDTQTPGIIRIEKGTS